MLAALITVGLTAPANGPFTIGITPVFLRLDAEAVAESRARALGLDVDIKLWTLHLGARLSNASRAPSSRASRGTTCEFRPFFVGGAGLLGACSYFSATLLAWSAIPMAALSPASTKPVRGLL